jgi:hypothetical protein
MTWSSPLECKVDHEASNVRRRSQLRCFSSVGAMLLILVIAKHLHDVSNQPFAPASMKGCNGVGFSDATRDVCVTRIVAWRRRSAQAGNRGVGLGGLFVAMEIVVVRVLLP